MILPNNGKIVIIDDKYEEVEALMAALAKEKMPFLFFKDQGGNDLPPNGNPIENVRLVFLDLDLGIGGANEIEKIRIIQGRLERILKENTPYVLIIWSNHFMRYGKALLKEFDQDFLAFKPLAYCSLDKTVINNPNLTEVIKTIQASLKGELCHYNSMNAFLLWESSVSEAAANITNELVSIFDRRDNWDKNMSSLLFKLAQEQAGKDYIAKLGDTDRIKSAFELIDSSLIESVENKFNEQLKKIELSVKDGGQDLSPNEKIRLNTKLHLIKSDSFSHFYSGNLYLKDINGMGREIVEKNFKKEKYKDFKEENTKLVCLDITPTCDYSQGKNYSRILYGIKVNGGYSKKDLDGGDYKYKLCPIMDIDTPSYIVFDYRYLKSYSREEFKSKFYEPPKFRIRGNLLLDIQAQMANHINRPGIITIN